MTDKSSVPSPNAIFVKKRPFLLTILALMFILLSAILMVGGTVLLVDEIFIPGEISLLRQIGIITIPFDQFIALGYVLGVVTVALGYGLWHLKRWSIGLFALMFVMRIILGVSREFSLSFVDILWFLTLLYLLKERNLFLNKIA